MSVSGSESSAPVEFDMVETWPARLGRDQVRHWETGGSEEADGKRHHSGPKRTISISATRASEGQTFSFKSFSTSARSRLILLTRPIRSSISWTFFRMSLSAA